MWGGVWGVCVGGVSVGVRACVRACVEEGVKASAVERYCARWTGPAACSHLANVLHVVALDVADHGDAQLLQKVQRQVVDGVPQNALLHEQQVAAGLFDLLAQLQNVLALLPQDLVHLVVLGDDDRVLHVGLRGREAKLDQADLRVLDGLDAARLAEALAEAEAVDHLGVVHGPADAGHDLDVVEVDVGGRVGVDDLEHGVDGERREHLGVLRDDLGGERGAGRVDQGRALGFARRLGLLGGVLGAWRLVRKGRQDAAEVHGRRDLFELELGLRDGAAVGLGDLGRVDAFGEEALDGVEEGAADDDDGGGAVAGLDVLRLGEADEHLGGRVLDAHLLEDGGAVVGDEDAAVLVLDHLVHAARAEGGADGVRDGLGREDVGGAHVL